MSMITSTHWRASFGWLLIAAAFAGLLFMISNAVCAAVLRPFYLFDFRFHATGPILRSEDGVKNQQEAKLSFVALLNAKIAEPELATFFVELVEQSSLVAKDKEGLKSQVLQTQRFEGKQAEFPIRLTDAFGSNEFILSFQLATQFPKETFAKLQHFAPELLVRLGKQLESHEEQRFAAVSSSRLRSEQAEFNKVTQELAAEKQEQLKNLNMFTANNFSNGNAFDWAQRWKNHQEKNTLLEQAAAALSSQRAAQKFANLQESSGLFRMPAVEPAHQNTATDFATQFSHSVRPKNKWLQPLTLACCVAALGFAATLAICFWLRKRTKMQASRLHPLRDFGRLPQTANHDEVFHAELYPNPTSSGRLKT